MSLEPVTSHRYTASEAASPSSNQQSIPGSSFSPPGNNLPRETRCSRTAHSLLPALEAPDPHCTTSSIFQALSSSQEFLGKTACPSTALQGPRTQPDIRPTPGPLDYGCPNARAPFSLTGWLSPLLQPARLHPAITALHSVQPPLAPALPAL